MRGNSRSWNSSRNAVIGFGCQLVVIVLTFAVRTIFARLLSEEYLGISGLYTNILTILNLTELGLNTAIVFALYKPIAESDQKTITALMQFYKKAYFTIGCAFLAVGLCLIPFLSKFMYGNTTLVYTTFVYLLYLLQTVTSYWFFAYRSALLTASQNEYIISITNCITNIIMSILQIMVLLIMRREPEAAFYLYVAIGVLSNIAMNAVLARIVRKRYPFIIEKGKIPIPKEIKKNIYKNVAGLSLYKISSTVNTSVDNVIIAGFIDIGSVGRYSNYLLINTAVNRMVSVVFNPLTASIGNLNVTESQEKKESVFWSLNLIYFWIYGFCGICMYVLFNPFIGGLWLGNNWLLSDSVAFALVLKFWIDGLLGAIIKYREAAGLFWQTKVRYILTTVVNLVVSIILVKYANLGILGVVIGSVVAEVLCLAVDPWIVFRSIFEKKPIRFYCIYLFYFILLLSTTFFIKYLSEFFNPYCLSGFLITLLLCMIVPNIIWFLIFRKAKEFGYISDIIMDFIHRFHGLRSRD